MNIERIITKKNSNINISQLVKSQHTTAVPIGREWYGSVYVSTQQLFIKQARVTGVLGNIKYEMLMMASNNPTCEAQRKMACPS